MHGGLLKKTGSLMSNLGAELPPVPAPAAAVVLNGGLDPYTGPWEFAEAAHLIRRTMFGVKKSDVELLLTMSMEDAVDYLLDVDNAPLDPPVNNYYYIDGTEEFGYDDPNVTFGDTWIHADYDEEAEGLRIESFRGWWVDQMVNQKVSIKEKMLLFWHNHFATQASEVFFGKYNYNHNRKLRENALGNFKHLTKVVTIDEMMLLYLNGFLNQAGDPDENYARELQELFTIGKDNPDHYTEDDVYQAARILTGWTIDFSTGLPGDTIFYPFLHDQQDKQFSSFYDNTVIQGSADGEAELDALLDMIFAKEEVAKFMVRKIYRWFVYYHITPTVETDIIEPLAELFRNSNYEIKPVLEKLLKSEHFFDATNKGCFIKTPIDLVVGTLRSFNLSLPGTEPFDRFYHQYLQNLMLSNMQMIPGDPPNVAGWQAFRQVPQYYRIWINSDTAKNRNQYTEGLSFGVFISPSGDVLSIDQVAFASQFSTPEDPNKLIDETVNLLLPQPISDLKKTVLKNILLSGLPNDSYWTVAWLDYINNPNDPMATEVVTIRLALMYNHILKLAEYQLA